ncbi:MAG TPA: hypothetical protein PKW55_00925 [Spirochaetota bacterium]|nr:hypothetical protein [Spirochaetota bacterium]HOM39205.1 hypothetical protein [Spirochaetota bacterium]HPQ49240.1 hypothetical protein [Spirochaetota bacterium]
MSLQQYSNDIKNFYQEISSERIDYNRIKGITISIFGAGEKSGKSIIASNLAYVLSNNLKVLYFSSKKDGYINPLKTINFSDDIFGFVDTKFQNIKYLYFSPKSSFLSSEKMESMLLRLPNTVSENFNFFIHTVKNTFDFPDRYIILNNHIDIVVTEINSNMFSNVFQILENLSFLPRAPKEIFILFNKCNSPFMAFEYYQKLISQMTELKIPVKIYFLGNIPFDELRCRISVTSNTILSEYFSDSPITGNFKFIAKRIINYSYNLKKGEFMISVNK